MMTKTWTEVWSFREELYSFFANSLLEPVHEENKQILTKDFWSNFPLEGYNQQLISGLEQLTQSVVKLEGLNTAKAIEKVNVEYTELFIGPGVPKAAPWESFYRTKD